MNRREVLRTAPIAAMGAALAATADRTSQAEETAAPGSRPVSWVEASDGTQLFCEDWGRGPTLLFLHAAASSTRQWDYNTVPLRRQTRCVGFDRRGHGRSSDAGRRFDYDLLADDLATVVERLDLRDVTVVAHSMACGEVVRYLTRHGTGRVSRLLMTGPTLPFILKTADNPDGVPLSALEAQRAKWLEDYPKWIADNARPFFTPEASEAMVQWGFTLATRASLRTVIDCNHLVTETDFREELTKVTVPTLIIHGEKDVSAQIDFTGRRTAKLIPGCKMKVYEGAAHGLFITHAERFNRDVLAFAGA